MNLSTALFLIIGLASIWFVYKMQRDNDAFDYADFLMTRSHADPHKALLLMAGVVSTWAIFHAASEGTLTETMLGVYLGAFVVNSGAQRAVGLIRDKKWEDPKP